MASLNFTYKKYDSTDFYSKYRLEWNAFVSY